MEADGDGAPPVPVSPLLVAAKDTLMEANGGDAPRVAVKEYTEASGSGAPLVAEDA